MSSAKHIGLGSIAVATRTTAICQMGEIGVCYEVYTLDNRPGYSFIFEHGGYDGFSPNDVATMLIVTGHTSEPVANYHFRNAGQLIRDYEAGRFAAAFLLPQDPMMTGQAEACPSRRQRPPGKAPRV